MLSRPLLLMTALLSLTVLSACSTQAPQMKKAAVSSSMSVSADHLISSPLPSTVNLADMAHAYGSTPGRVALSLVICRMDRSNSLQSLAQKSAQDLFAMLRETATQNTQTLESLNIQFHLTDILASENIYVKIHANAADALSAPIAPAANWIEQFQAAYAASGNRSSS